MVLCRSEIRSHISSTAVSPVNDMAKFVHGLTELITKLGVWISISRSYRLRPI